MEAQLPGLGGSLDILAEPQTADVLQSRTSTKPLTMIISPAGLAYAVGHEARALVVIAEEHRLEFVAVADYLNRCQEAAGDEHGIAVFLVSLSVERIADAYVPRFTVLSQPNAWRVAVAASESERLASVEDFVNACDQEIRMAAEQILRDWQQLPGSSVRFKRNSVALYVRNPFKAGGGGSTSVFVLYTNGQLTLNRGYLIEGNMASQDRLPAIDQQIRSLFPAGRWGEKSYYISIPAPPDADAMLTLFSCSSSDPHATSDGQPSLWPANLGHHPNTPLCLERGRQALEQHSVQVQVALWLPFWLPDGFRSCLRWGNLNQNASSSCMVAREPISDLFRFGF